MSAYASFCRKLRIIRLRDKLELWLSVLVSKAVKVNNVTICHSERSVSEVEESTH